MPSLPQPYFGKELAVLPTSRMRDDAMHQAALFSVPVTPVSGLLVVILLAVAFVLVKGPDIWERWRDVLSKRKPPHGPSGPSGAG
jgi:hypothetical protein